LDSQLPMQMVPVTTDVVNLKFAQARVIYFVRDLGMSWFSTGTPVSPINKTESGIKNNNPNPNPTETMYN